MKATSEETYTCQSRANPPFGGALRRGRGEGRLGRVKPAERKRNVPSETAQCVFKEQKGKPTLDVRLDV